MEKRRQVAEAAARAAGAVHLRYRRDGIDFKTKDGNPRDLVTEADTEAERVARAVIAAEFPGEAIVGEEDGSSGDRIAAALAERAWLIDPLDGTFNFVHGFPDFSATIAWVEVNKPAVAATFAPVFDECFTAARDLGATLNGAPIKVSTRRGLSNAIVNFWNGRSEDAVSLELASQVRQRTFSQRTFGGTALVLAYLACGRFDVYYTAANTRMGPWDVAAGALLIEEAGGVAVLTDGSPFRVPSQGMAAAADKETLQEMLDLVNEFAPTSGSN